MTVLIIYSGLCVAYRDYTEFTKCIPVNLNMRIVVRAFAKCVSRESDPVIFQVFIL